MTIHFPDLKDVIKIYHRKGAKSPLAGLEKPERREGKVIISEEARRLAQKFLNPENKEGLKNEG